VFQESDNIEDRLSDIQAKWEMLENKAKERSKRLEDAVGMQLFNNGVSSLLLWIDSTKSALNATETVRDVQVKMIIIMLWTMILMVLMMIRLRRIY